MRQRRPGGAGLVLAIFLAATATFAVAQGPAGYDPRLYVRPPGIGGQAPPEAMASLASQLSREAQDLITATRFELAGTLQGQQTEAAARFLAGGAARLSQANRPDAADRAIGEITQAQAQIQNALAGFGGSALPRTDAAVRRIDRLIFEITRIAGIAPAPGPGVFPTTGRYNPAAIARQTGTLSASLSATIERIAQEVGQQYPYDAAIRGLDAARSQAAQIGLMAQQGASLNDLRAAFESVRAQVVMASKTISDARPSPGIAQTLRLSQQDLNALESLLALNPNHVVPDRPVLIDPPAFPNLPYPVAPPGTTAPPRKLVALIDEALSVTDAFVAAVQPGVLTIPEGAQFLADGRQVLVGLSTLRQAAFDPGGPRAMRNAFQRVERDYERLQRRTQRVSQGRLGPNIQRVQRLGDILATIRRAMPVY